MEYRKLIRFGNSSFVVSLPKDWLKKKGLKKGDTVYLDVDNSEIRLKAQEKIHREEIEKYINIDNLEREVIERKINAAYINNADIIRIKGNQIHGKSKIVKRKIQNLVAMEVVEQTTESIVARSFLNMEDVKIENMIRKADHIVKSMFQDLKRVAESPVLEAVEISDNISQRDEDVNKMTFLVFRALNHNIKRGKSKEGLESKDMLAMWGINFFIEEIGDEVKRIARAVAQCESREILKDYTIIITKLEECYCNTLKGFYGKDKKLVYEEAGRRQALMQEIDEMFQENLNSLTAALMDKTKDLVDKIQNLNRISIMSGTIPTD